MKKASHFRRQPMLLALALIFLLAAPQISSAGSATWSANPISTDWSVAANWTPATVPNGANDVASFGVSSLPQVDLLKASNGGQLIEFVSAIQFNPGADGFTITSHSFGGVGVTGAGVVNRSGVTQTFDNAAVPGQLGAAVVTFYNSASAGDLVTFTNSEGTDGGTGVCTFLEDSSAGTATFLNEGGSAMFAWGGQVSFYSQASASSASFTNKGATNIGTLGGEILFHDTATAAQGVFINDGASNTGLGAEMFFFSQSTAGSAVITNNGGTVRGAGGGTIYFSDSSNCESAVITNNGGTEPGAEGAMFTLTGSASAHRAIIVANGGTNGGDGAKIIIGSRATARYAQFKVYGNALLDTSGRGRGGIKIGSLEGDGNVLLGAQNLAVGLNNRETVFSGVILDGRMAGGSLTKLGAGSLELRGANTYTGGTSIEAGTLLTTNSDGSGTGAGPVAVNGGALGGSGVIAGQLIIGTGLGSGASLAPANGRNKPLRLTTQSSLTFKSDATYDWLLNTNQPKADQMIAKGVVIDAGAVFSVRSIGSIVLSAGISFVIIDNTASTPISGAFANLAEGAIISVNGNDLQANYGGGDGNDLTLTVVP